MNTTSTLPSQRPRIVIPSQHVSSPPHSSVPAVTPKSPVPDAEKVGRWSDEEHEVFLQGLEKYGKQWKTIAQMIGTRTVVQVRTHAQKYFQKMERKQSKQDVQVVKRKPLTNVVAPRKKSKPASPKRSMPRATVSLNSPTRDSPELLLPTLPFSESSVSSSTENLSIISPSNVAEIAELDFHMATCQPTQIEETLYLGEDDMDPLEWLIDGGLHHLPESSLENAPMFPEFTTASQQNDGNLSSEAFLKNIVDPKVTVQSLFLEDEP